MEDLICSTTAIPVPPGTTPVIDFEVDTEGEWVLWSNRLDDIFTFFAIKLHMYVASLLYSYLLFLNTCTVLYQTVICKLTNTL